MDQKDNIINFINTNASNIKDEDLDLNIIPKLMEHYEGRINYLTFRAYGNAANNTDVASGAFKERSKEELSKGLRTFLFTSEHWKTGRDINSYLLTCLNYLADRIKNDTSSIKRVNVPICPGCRFLGHKEFISYEAKQLRCTNCTKELERLNSEILQINNDSVKNSYLQRIQIHKIFCLHSRKGWRCFDCERFIPDSHIMSSGGVSCPYSNCVFFGHISELQVMVHPVALGIRNDLSLDESYGKDDKSTGWDIWQDKLKSNEINADIQIGVKEQFNNEFNIAKEIIEIQMNRIKLNGLKSTSIQKTLMYQAFINMLNKFPEEMISYLVHLKQNSDFPIQSRIFQEYTFLMSNTLPFTIVKGGNYIDIMSLIDQSLGLFSGISKFSATVQNNKIIPNNTSEIYTGGINSKCRGQYFIGMIIDVVDITTGKSIKDKIEQYSFVQIKMSNEILPGTQVEVSHFRLVPHYEMGNLVYLQRIRRKIVDSIYFKMNGKKRETKHSCDGDE